MVFLVIYIFLIGASLGSFINVLGLRIVAEKSLWKGRSCCDHCGCQVASYDLVPVLSYLWLKGKCRYCGKSIGIRHLIVESLDGLLTLLVVYCFKFTWYTVIMVLIVQLFILITLIDFDSMIIPDQLIILLMGLFSISYIYIPSNISLLSRILGLISVSGIMILINYFIGESFGGGDIKLMMVCGFGLGLEFTLLSGCIAVLVAGVYAGYLMRLKQVGRKDYIPFGPFLCLGMIVSITYGTPILQWYLNLC